MKIALKVISLLVFGTLVIGFAGRYVMPGLDKLYRLGWVAFAFLWVPFFLFFRFDQKQQKKQAAGQEPDDSPR